MTTTMRNTLTRFFLPTTFKGRTVIDRLVELQSIRNERRALAKMDADRLADIGISARDAKQESRRPAWDAPERWLR